MCVCVCQRERDRKTDLCQREKVIPLKQLLFFSFFFLHFCVVVFFFVFFMSGVKKKTRDFGEPRDADLLTQLALDLQD